MSTAQADWFGYKQKRSSPGRYLGPIERSTIGSLGVGFTGLMTDNDVYLFGSSVLLRLHSPQVDLGIELSGGQSTLSTGLRCSYLVTPTVGRHLVLHHTTSSMIQGYGVLRLPIQRRYEAALPAETGYAVAAEAGAQYWICDETLCMGLAIGLRYRYHLTKFQMSPVVLPVGSSMLTIPISVSIAGRFN